MKEERTCSLLLKLIFHICIFIGTIIAFLLIVSSLLNMTVLEFVITEILVLLSWWPIGLIYLFIIGCAYFASELGENRRKNNRENQKLDDRVL